MKTFQPVETNVQKRRSKPYGDQPKHAFDQHPGKIVHILVVDDEDPILDFITKTLSRFGWEHIDVARSGEEALSRLGRGHYELCILDLKMPFIDGFEVLKIAKEKGVETEFVVVTGYGTVENAVEAMKLGAKEFLQKPLQSEPLNQVVCRLMQKFQSVPHILAEKMDVFLARNADNNSLRVDDICRYFEISSRYVSYLFKNFFGCSFPQRLVFHRVQRAKKLMETMEQSLSEVAIECGFKDYRRLHEAFHQLEGMSPGDLRKIIAEKRISLLK